MNRIIRETEEDEEAKVQEDKKLMIEIMQESEGNELDGEQQKGGEKEVSEYDDLV